MSSAFDGAGRPTRTSTAIASLVTGVVVVVLLGEVESVLWPAVIGSAGMVCLAGCLALVTAEGAETVTALLVSVLSVATGGGLLVGTVGTALVLVGSLFPAENAASVSVQMLTLGSRLGIVVGCLLAVLGVLLGVGNVVDDRSLSSYFWLTAKTGLVPGLLGAAMVAGAFLTRSQPRALIGSLPAALSRWLLAPTPAVTHLGTLSLLVAVAILSVRAAVDALPITELLADTGDGETETERIAQLQSLLWWVGAVWLAVLPVTVVTELIVGPIGLRQTVGTTPYQLLVDLSTAPAVRATLVGATALAVSTVAVVRLLQRVARGSVVSFTRRIGPFVGGGIVTAGAIAFARPIIQGLLEWVAGRLPGAFAAMFRRSSVRVVDVFGASTVVVALSAGLIGVTAATVFGLRLALVVGYLSSGTAGYSLASAGLFVATAFAGTVGAGLWLVFGGIVGCFVVWEMGRYGTTLGEEIGRHAPSRDAELVHAGGTLAVGLAGAGVAYGISTTMMIGRTPTAATAVVALTGVLVGIVFLVTALR
jgi:hypothetical protein